MSFAFIVTLLSFVAPAPSPSVPTAEAQRAWTWRAELNVPWRDVNGDGRNDYNPHLWFKIERLTDYVKDRCEWIIQQGDTYLLNANGWRPVVVIEFGNRTPECRLTVKWGVSRPSGVSGIKWALVEGSEENVETSWDNPITRATYTDGRTFYIPELNFQLPGRVPAVLYGTTFEVQYRRVAGTHGACRLHPDLAKERWHITDTGALERHPDTKPVELIDSPAALSDTCSYEMTWPNIEGFTRPAGDALFSGTRQSQTGIYSGSIKVPDIEVVLSGATPVAARNTDFQIRYDHAAASPDSCKLLDVQSDRWRISASGAASVTTEVTLVDYPETAPDDLCLYEVVWPDIAGLVKPAENPIIAPTLGRNSARGVYTVDTSSHPEDTWVHKIEITIPFLDRDGDGINDYDPQFSFVVQPRPVAPGSSVGSWTVDGAVCPSAWETGDPRPDLVVRPRISKEPNTTLIDNAQIPGLTSGCRLATEFPRTIASGVPGITLQANLDCLEPSCRWRLDYPSHEKFTKSDRDTAKVTYEDGRLQMRPDLTINLPDPLPTEAEGAEFEVQFEADRPECRTGPNTPSQRWRINAQGQAQSASSAPVLSRVEAGGRVDQDDDFCAIEVVWPYIPGLVRPENAVLQPSFRTWETDNQATGTYKLPWGHRSDTTYFHPTEHQQGGLVVNVEGGLPSNISYSVTVSPATGFHIGCDADPDSSRRSKTYSIRAPVQPLNAPETGTYPSAVRFTTEGRHLVARPGSGVSGRCRYVATFPTDEEGSSANYPTSYRTGSQLLIDLTPNSAVASNRYAANPDRAEVQVRTDAEVMLGEGEVWSVLAQVSPTASSPEGCTATHTVEAREDRSGSSFIVAPLDLLWEDPLTTRACTYDVAFPARLGIGTQTWRVDPDYADDQVLTVSGSSRIARQRYSADELLAGEVEVLVAQNVDSDVEFMATVSAANDPVVEGCTPEQEVAVEVSANDQSATTSLLGLMKQQVGATGSCEYSVEFDETEVGGSTYRLDPRYDAPVTMLSDGSLTARQRYTADTFFDGEVVVSTAAAVAEDTSFLVGVAASNDPPIAGCSAPPPTSVSILAGERSATLALDDLVLRAADATGDCAYAVTFPPHEEGFAAAYVVDDTFADAKLTITPDAAAGSSTAQQRYALNVSPSPSFTGTVEVLLTEAVSIDTDFAVSIAPAAGGPDGCSTFPDQTVTVAAGTQTTIVTFVDLLQTPLDAASDCSYEVTFPADVLGEGAHWFPDSTYTAVTSLTHGTTAASQQYAPRLRLYPTTGPNAAYVLLWVTEEVPPTVSFEVTVSADANAPTGCGTYVATPVTSFTETVAAPTLARTPTRVELTDELRLIRRPADATTDCEYDVMFGPDEAGPGTDYPLDANFAGVDLDITPASPVAQHRYGALAGERWTAKVEIAVPFRDEDGDGVNDYDPQFTLPLSADAASDGAGGACETTALAPRLRNEAASETVADQRVAAMAPGCVLAVEFTSPVASGVAGVDLTLATTPAAQSALAAATPTATATYSDGREAFQPELTITLPDPLPASAHDAALMVRFTPTAASHAACGVLAVDDHDDWEITDAGVLQRDADGDRATLVGVPAPVATSEPCAYEVTWPDIPGLVTPTPSTLTYVLGDPTSTQLAVAYLARSAQTEFAPEIALDVPLVDYNDDGSHDYGTTTPPTSLRVLFSPQTASQGEGCSPADTAVTYTIIADTSAPQGETGARTKFEVSPANFMLIDRPENSEHRCRYDAEFDTTDPRQNTIFWRLDKVVTPATDDNEAWADDPAVRATYANADQVRSVALELIAEAAADGETFTVTVATVAPPQSNDRFARCTGVTVDGTGAVTGTTVDVTLTVGATGTASGATTLVDWPAEHDALADRCAYEVRWPDSEDGATIYRITGEATTSIDAGVFAQPTPTVTNTYSSAVDTFDATLELVTAPDIAADVSFDVTINQVGVLANCSPTQTLPVAAATPNADGTTDAQAALTVEDLVDRPAGSTARCTYVVDWPATDAGAGNVAVRDDTFAITTALDRSSRTARARYQAAPLPEPEPVEPEPPQNPAEGPAQSPTTTTQPPQSPTTTTQPPQDPAQSPTTTTQPPQSPTSTTQPPQSPTTSTTQPPSGGSSSSNPGGTGSDTGGGATSPDPGDTSGGATSGGATGGGSSPDPGDTSGGTTSSNPGDTSSTTPGDTSTSNPNDPNDGTVSTTPGDTTGGNGGTNPGDTTGGTSAGQNGNEGSGTPTGGNPQSTGGGGSGPQPTSTPNVAAPRSPSVGGGTSRISGSTSRGGSSGGGGTSRGSSSGGGSSTGGSGGGSSGPWQVATSSRVPVTVSVITPPAVLPAAVAIEVLINVPGTCGDDVTAFAGMPAEIGLVYALMVTPGATVDVLSDDALSLPSHAASGDSTRGCELRLTLLTAPAGCTLASSREDEAGRPYVDVDGGADASGFTLTPTLSCG